MSLATSLELKPLSPRSAQVGGSMCVRSCAVQF
jgi:hypothetical protein